MATQLNFTDIVFGEGTDSFSSTIFKMPGRTSATLFQRPKKVVHRRQPGGFRDIERPILHGQRMTWDGEFFPGNAWINLFGNFLKGRPSAASGTAFGPDDSAPVEYFVQVATDDGAEKYSLESCALASISISWQTGQLPVYRCEWLIRNREFIEEGSISAATDDEALDSRAMIPEATPVYLFPDATTWPSDPPPSGLQADAQSAAVIFAKDLDHVQFDGTTGRPTRYGWTNAVDVHGRLQTQLSGSNASSISNGTVEGLIRVEMPRIVSGAVNSAAFYVDIDQAQMSIQNLPVHGDLWATRQIEFVNQISSSGGMVRVVNDP